MITWLSCKIWESEELTDEGQSASDDYDSDGRDPDMGEDTFDGNDGSPHGGSGSCCNGVLYDEASITHDSEWDHVPTLESSTLSLTLSDVLSDTGSDSGSGHRSGNNIGVQMKGEVKRVTDDKAIALTPYGVQVPKGTYAALQCNAVTLKDFAWLVPKPVVIVVQINKHPARALLDSGSLGDFMSTSLADQLGVTKSELKKPLPLQLAVQGSQSRVNWGTTVNFKYQSIDEEPYFDIANLSSYDVVLGTPWIFAHCVTFGLNPAHVIVGSNPALLLKGDAITKIASHAMEITEERIQHARNELIQYALPLCKEMVETGLFPL